MIGEGLLKGLKITVRHFFGKAITEQYPERTPTLAPRFHGSFSLNLNEENCNACNNCANACPNGVIVIESDKDPETKKRYPVSFKMYLEYCLFCGLCVENCNRDGLHFNTEFALSVYSKPQTIYELAASKEEKASNQ